MTNAQRPGQLSQVSFNGPLSQARAAWLTTVGSAQGPVTVVRPLGQLDGLELSWPSPLTRYGSDPPAWR